MGESEVYDISEVARIGMMFLDGDKLEVVLKDRFSVSQDDTNYNSDIFNDLKITLLKIEKINPALKLGAVLWQLRPDNSDMVVPVIFGSELVNGPREILWPPTPASFWTIQPLNDMLKQVFITGADNSRKWSNGGISYYFAVRNSDDEITGVLELQQPAVGG